MGDVKWREQNRDARPEAVRLDMQRLTFSGAIVSNPIQTWGTVSQNPFKHVNLTWGVVTELQTLSTSVNSTVRMKPVPTHVGTASELLDLPFSDCGNMW